MYRSSLPPLPHQRAWRWYRSRSRIVQIVIGLLSIFVLCATCSGVAQGVSGASSFATPTAVTQATAVPTQAAFVATSAATATPTAKPTPTPTPKPTREPTPRPTQPPAKPTPTPAPKCVAVNNNPWCYNFSPGSLIYSPNAAFCSYFSCVSTFWTATRGYVAECSNGEYTHSGGVSGACSRDGGVLRPLYSH